MDGLREGSRIAMGSLPAMDPLTAVQAQFRIFPEIPAWPQLPKRSPREAMHLQGLSGLPGITWPTLDQGIFTLSSRDMAEALETLQSENGEDRLDRAALRPEEAAGFFAFLKEAPRLLSASTLALKGQAAGPVTLGLTLRDENGKNLLGSRDSMEVLTQYLLMHCRWQVRELSRLGRPVVFFFDEPFFSGSFQPEAHGIGWEDIRGWLTFLLEGLQAEGVLTGLHTCGDGPWERVLELPMEIFHFDAFQFSDRLLGDAKGLRRYLEQGGMVSWGMVPATPPGGRFPNPDELFHRWESSFRALTQRGLPEEQLIGRSFFSTACGLGNGSLAGMEDSARTLGSLLSLWRANLSRR